MIPVSYSLPWNRPNPLDRRAFLNMAADSGIKHLVLSSSIIDELISRPELIGIYQQELAEHHLDLVDAHAPWGTWKDPGMPLPDGHELIVLRQKMAIRICHIFGVTSLAFHTGNTFRSIFGDFSLDDYYHVLIGSLEELLPDAEKYGVVLCLENQWTPLNQSAYLLKAMEYFQSPYLGLCYDSGHAFLTENGWKDPARSTVPTIWNDQGLPVVWEKDLIGKFQPYLVNCHLHDNDGFMDQHKLPQAGSIGNWQYIMEKITTAPHLQCVQAEVKFPESGMSFAQLRQAFCDLSDRLDG